MKMAFRVNAATASRSIRAGDLLSARFPTLAESSLFVFFESFSWRNIFFRQFDPARRSQIVGSGARKTQRFLACSRSLAASIILPPEWREDDRSLSLTAETTWQRQPTVHS
jgi:hypothetical protein